MKTALIVARASIALAVVAGGSLAAAAPLGSGQAQPAPLARARELYNQHKYDAAIQAATEALSQPASADAAAVVLARAHLERFGQTSDAADLTAARDALKRVDAARLSARDRDELLVGLGQSLYYDERYGASAELFGIALGRADSPDTVARDRLFEWWAGALDRQAQLGPDAQRKPLYARILQRAEDELRRDDKSAVAAYWLVAAARGTDDLERAWSAAVAAWVRAPHTWPRGLSLRDDLDELVRQVIIPELAQRLAGGADPRPTSASYQAQWDDIKKKWKDDLTSDLGRWTLDPYRFPFTKRLASDAALSASSFANTTFLSFNALSAWRMKRIAVSY